MSIRRFFNESFNTNKQKLVEWKAFNPTNNSTATVAKNTSTATVAKNTSSGSTATTAKTPAATLHPASRQVINNFDNNLSYHISELEDEDDDDIQDSIDWFEDFPDIDNITQNGSDIIFNLSKSVGNDDEITYWILTYALGEIGNEIAENGTYTVNGNIIKISLSDFNDALANGLA